MKAYKGFNKDMTCRGFQYEEGKAYETESAELCDHGFHACEYPLDCFGYYPPANSVYREVELDGVTNEERDDTKRVGTKLTVKGALNIKGLINATFEYIKGSALTGGKCSALVGEDGSALTAGGWSVLSGGHWSALVGGTCAVLSGGFKSALIGGFTSVLTGGSKSALISGNKSALTGGDSSVIYGGIGSKVRGGLYSVLAIRYYVNHSKVRIAFAEVDGEKIKANTWYKLNEQHEFVEVE